MSEIQEMISTMEVFLSRHDEMGVVRLDKSYMEGWLIKLKRLDEQNLSPTPGAGCEDKVNQTVQETAALVLLEVEKATKKFPTWPTDPLHALAVLGEEYGELSKAVLQHTYEPHKSTIDDVRIEAVQTAAMALRFLMSLPRYEYKQCGQHDQKAKQRVSHGETLHAVS